MNPSPPPAVTWTGYIAVHCSDVAKTPSYPSFWKPTAKLSRNKPSVGRDEVAVKVEISLPASLFTRPTLEARITVPADSVTPLVVDLETRSNVEDLIAQVTGFDVKLLPVKGQS